MTDVLDIGQYIYDKLGWVDSWKLQKLTYYVQAWNLAWEGRPAFDHDIQAWPDGPVSWKLWRDKKYTSPPLSSVLPSADPDRIPARTQEVIDAVLEFYGSMKSNDLIDLTHEELPWQEARDGLSANDRSNQELSLRTMRRYYSRQAMIGAAGPAAPACIGQRDSDVDAIRSISQRESLRWKDTLDWLATR